MRIRLIFPEYSALKQTKVFSGFYYIIFDTPDWILKALRFHMVGVSINQQSKDFATYCEAYRRLSLSKFSLLPCQQSSANKLYCFVNNNCKLAPVVCCAVLNVMTEPVYFDLSITSWSDINLFDMMYVDIAAQLRSNSVTTQKTTLSIKGV